GARARYENQNQSKLLSTTTFGYGEGRVSGIPPRFWERNYGGYFFKPNMRGKAAVVYSDITETYDDGTSKTTYYTTDTSYPGVEQLRSTIYNTNSGYTVIQANEDINWGLVHEVWSSTEMIKRELDIGTAKLANAFFLPN